MANKTRNPVGWGYLEDGLSDSERRRALEIMQLFFGGGLDQAQPPAVDAVILNASRLDIPDALSPWLTRDHGQRLLHALGRSFHDLARLREQSPLSAPDVVAYPDSEEALQRVLAWADKQRLAVIPFGGGSSVVGGVTPENLDHWNGAVSVDLQKLSGLIDVDTRSQVVHARAGTLGPDLDAGLKAHGLTMRYFPQSYFHSTVGGWVATRGAGHFSTLYAKIEDQVQALRVMLPDGRMVETRPLPASSVGPDPNRLWCGSEGFLGFITSASLRVQKQPVFRDTRGIVFQTFEEALEAGRAIVQAGLWPAQLRMLDPAEHLQSRMMAGASASGALMIVGFESGQLPVEWHMQQALTIAADFGGQPEAQAAGGDGVSDWRQAFFRQPYMRDLVMDYGIIADTFETAIPWRALPDFYHQVRDATQQALDRVCGGGAVMCRTTHAYTDGICLYYSFYGRGRSGGLVEQWRELKALVSDAVMAGGGTISHHHAMGRDHKQWAKQEVPEAFRAAIRAAKGSLDPGGIMNPGLWFDD